MINTRQKTILIISEVYPSDNTPYALAFIHTRVKQYQREGYRVTILSFRAQENYEFDGVSIFSEKNFVKSGQLKAMDCVISHAPNVRNHFRFILKFRRQLAKLVFVFHGHEILKVSKEYPKPYAWNTSARKQRKLQNLYDPIKLLLVRISLKFLMRRVDTKLIFVSKWLRQKFFDNIFVCDAETATVINNPISEHFVRGHHNRNETCKNLSAICIRPLDASKYAVDLVLFFAKANPKVHFDIFGKGRLPEFVEVPENVTFHARFFRQSELPVLLDNYDFGILPTRWDSQGVIACEFAKYGIPLITSDILIMREMLGPFANVAFFPNDNFSTVVDARFLKSLKYQKTSITDERFSLEKIVCQELSFMCGE